MSAEFEPLQARDVLPSRRILSTAAVAVVVTLLGITAAALILRIDHREGATSAAPARAPAEIARVEQSLIESTRRGIDLRAAQREALEHYRWIDRDAGLATIPIERAIDLTAERAR